MSSWPRSRAKEFVGDAAEVLALIEKYDGKRYPTLEAQLQEIGGCLQRARQLCLRIQREAGTPPAPTPPPRSIFEEEDDAQG